MPRQAKLFVISLGVFYFTSALHHADAADQGPTRQRPSWTTSRLKGSPDPPPEFRVERAFPNLQFEMPLLAIHAPGTKRLFVAERFGKVYSFRDEPDVPQPDLFIDFREALPQLTPHPHAAGLGSVYGLVFPADFPANPICYICYTLKAAGKRPNEPLEDGTRLSRFRVLDPSGVPRVDVESEEVLLTWPAGGHNGGCLKFGPDGYLYVSAGDAASPNPPDPRRAGQDLTNVLSSIMRIDVSRAGKDRPYAIPSDNPFLGQKNVRPEIWAYGFRNPWRMNFDPFTGDLFVGDVGWEAYEMVHRVVSAGNYGWSIKEGPQVVLPETPRGPTPILPAAIAYPHSVGASVTGGYVYRGKRFPELRGAYIYGDYETRRIWAARFDGDKLASNVDLVPPSVRIVSFGEDSAGEILMLDFDEGALYRFERNHGVSTQTSFPRLLSETGLFADTARHELESGVLPFSVNVSRWEDGTFAERFVAIPGDASIEILPQFKRKTGSTLRRLMDFPLDSVLGRTVYTRDTAWGEPRRVETQVLHFNGENFRGYTYAWNTGQTDAALVPATGETAAITSTIDAQPVAVKHRFFGRNECLRCHNPWVGHALAFTLPQLNRVESEPSLNTSSETATGDVRLFAEMSPFNQLHRFIEMGLFEGDLPRFERGITSDKRALPLADLNKQAYLLTQSEASDSSFVRSSSDTNLAARSYLHVNCAHCHQRGAGGTATIDLRFEISRESMQLVGRRPAQGTFNIANPQLVAVGDPYRSVLFYRMAKIGRGRMPHIGSEHVDEKGLRLMRQWIEQQPIGLDRKQLISRIHNEQTRSDAISEALAATSTALWLSNAIAEGPESHSHGIMGEVRNEIIAAAVKRSEPEIRDLFERFLPPEQRTRRLGTDIKPEAILALTGDADRGRKLFFDTAGVQCKTCHQINNQGGKIGPALDQSGKPLRRDQLLESILEPSKSIDPKYVSWLVQTTEGKVLTGLLAERTKQAVVLVDATNNRTRIPTEDIEELLPQERSIMPDLLLRDMTAAQVADLLAYLESVRP